MFDRSDLLRPIAQAQGTGTVPREYIDAGEMGHDVFGSCENEERSP